MLEEFRLRREKLAHQIGNEGVAILFAAEESRLGGGPGYPYQQNSDFYYLTGFVEPEAVAVLVPEGKDVEFILFNREQNPEKEVWCGKCVGQNGAFRNFGADQAFPISKIDDILPGLLSDRENIYSNIDAGDPRYNRIKRWLAKPARKLRNVGEILHKMRLKKSPGELEIIRRAVDITTKGHLRAMQKCRPETYEYELEAELLYEFNRFGAKLPSFEVIVASGSNACTLHYAKNSKKMVSGELVLVDAGIKYDYYCTDVTRTFPVKGVFTPEQRAIYEIVLEAQKKVISEIRPKVLWSRLQSVAERTITEGLVDIGILQGSVESILEQKGFQRFFMHKIGHWLGIDIHDVGGYSEGDNSLSLEPNMVFTVEPGIYISPDIAAVDDKWQGIGVRIEDNVLVTEGGREVLTRKIPSEIVEIEKIRDDF